MSQAWRRSVGVIIALVVLAGIMPNALLSGSNAVASSTSAQRLPTDLSPCAMSNCGKGGPTSPTPSPTIVAVLAAGLLALTAASQLRRRLRTGAESLPRGTALTQFHPPQFS